MRQKLPIIAAALWGALVGAAGVWIAVGAESEASRPKIDWGSAADWEPPEPPAPESIEDYAARVERAKQRLAIRGNTDPKPYEIALELRRMRAERPLY